MRVRDIYMSVCMKEGEDVRWWSVRGAVSVRLVECGAGEMWGWWNVRLVKCENSEDGM